MKFFQSMAVAANLLASGLAIEIRFHDTNNCIGGYVYCPTINPNHCCLGPGSMSTYFAWIPREWSIDTRVFEGKVCSGVSRTQRSGSRDAICMGAEWELIQSARYDFVGKKRGETSDGNTGDEECQKPSGVVFADGAHYQFDAMTESQVVEMFLIDL
ncbi:uncharacterized protein B0I36DRAFT_361303 [Microdochium trichocladiopsis]|uniref:Uncharacterized protein n=1 Tax=Microdochium trichocladiopsis TaxID=1682393 RepID=A0A9P9BRK9_9PEZI|nr:uncharacterized protein B0I36DRAFT_361303 [Microdochium trichocladiopsis]KAH7035998.1 hypothetical protein B0I36DRAFT_361303 [Microdochium trichocladiopsis]